MVKFVLHLRSGAFFLLLIVFSPDLQAQRWLGLRSDSDTTAADRKGFAVIPLLYYTPDTRWAYGASGVYYFSIPAKDSTQKDTRLSYAQMLVDYTQNNQLDLWATWNIFTPNENYLLKGELRYRNFPDRFYGIGNNTEPASVEMYSYDLFSFKALGMRRLGRHLFAGVDIHLGKEYNFVFEEDGQLNSGDIPGAEELNEVGFGLVLTYDERDNVINAYSGRFFEFSSYHYNKSLGSTFAFTSFQMTYMQFHSFRKRHVLAFQARVVANTGNVPFLDMATVGNEDLLRGYARNRFRDRNFGGMQAEYRFPLWKRLGGVAFGGAGDVFNQFSDLSFDRVKYSYGLGLRFLVNPVERLNIRLDYGFGRGNRAFYLMVTEAF